MGFEHDADRQKRADRQAAGRELRKDAPRSALASWRPPGDRPDAVDMIELSHLGRVERLIPVRIGRMCASPYAFLRGNAAIMAEDFSQLPTTGLRATICGDAHVGNFGFYASPERALVFDLNDFDEAHPGSWEWDLRRLTTSVWVAGRQNGFAEDTCADAVAWCVRAYRRQVLRLSKLSLLEQSFERLDLDRMREQTADYALRFEIERAADKARGRTSDRALPKLTVEKDGTRRIVEQAPLVTSLPDDEAERLVGGLDQYLETLPKHWRRVLERYMVVDVATKVVGVGSVGLRAYVALLVGNGPDDPLFLQAKQARRSCVARYVHGEEARHEHQGQRVVEYQKALQTVSDPLLGWTTVDNRQYYVRQFRDMKGAIMVEGIDGSGLMDYARICGTLLAKGHARTADAAVLAGYLGQGDAADRAFSKFAAAYADQTERDHDALLKAVKRGRLPAEFGI
jgi:uncharacterized protein (DUF2252 family)